MNPKPNIDLETFQTPSKQTAYKYVPLPCATTETGRPITWETLDTIASHNVRFISLLPHFSTPANIDSVAYIPLSGLGLSLCNDEMLKSFVTSIVRATTVMRLEGKEIHYEIKPVTTPFERLGESHRTTSDWRYYQIYADELKDYLSINNLARGMNYMHPVTQFILETRDMKTDRYKWFRWGMHFVAQELVNDKDFDEKQPSEWGEDTLHHVKLAINHWKKVKWDELPEDVRPPYKILFPYSERSYDVSLEFLEKMLKKAGVKKLSHEIGLANLE